MQSLLLAGGKGTRLRPLTIHTPKPILPIVNRPFLTYQIELLKKAGIKEITLSLSYPPAKIEEMFGDGQEQGVRIRYAVESSPLGTAGAYRNALGQVRETTVVVNGDILTNLNVADVIAWHREHKAVATIVLAPVENPASYGLVEADDDGRVLRFVEKPKPDQITCNTINAGVYVLEPRVLDYIPDSDSFSFEYQLFPKLLAAGEPFQAYVWKGYWRDIGSPQRYLLANDDLLNSRVKGYAVKRPDPPKQANGGDPARIDKLSLVDPSCTLKAGAEIVAGLRAEDRDRSCARAVRAFLSVGENVAQEVEVLLHGRRQLAE